jgi:hypothetical protein
MGANYVNPLGGVCGTGTDHRILPEAELWTQVILQAITDLDGRTSLTPHWAKNSAREWFASDGDAVGSFIWACQIINVDPNFIRSRLAKKQRVKKSDQVMPAIAQKAKALRGKDSPLSDNVDRAEARPALKRLVA